MHPWLHLPGVDTAFSAYFASIALGLILGSFVLRREARREGIPVRVVFDAALLVVPAGAVGARLWMLFEDPAHYLAHPADLVGFTGGLVAQGAFFGVIAAVVIIARARNVSAWRLIDVFTPAFPFGLAFGRMGCLASGCCHGRPADWPLGIEVPWSVRYLQPGRVPEELLVVPLHPSPIYEALLALGLFVWVSRVRTRQRYAGQAMVTLLVGYGVGRFVLEFFRGDLERSFHLGDTLSTAQITCAAMLAAGLALHRHRIRTCSPS